MPEPTQEAADGTESAASEYLVPLSEIDASDSSHAGIKAANLGELVRAKFTVPEGYVLTTRAFDRFIQENGLEGGASPEVVTSAQMPREIRRVVASIPSKLGEALLAVRSSGVAEDLAGASFAGQYETVLGVRGGAELEDAVKRCWASAFSTRVREYSGSRASAQTPRMGVLIQKLIRAEAAGVAFTADPVTGERDEVVVNSVKGLGERLVSGKASPDEWRIRGSSVTCAASPEKAISPKQALLVAELARRVEEHFGIPQDIEWATAGDRLYLLQARPITKLQETPTEYAVSAQAPAEVSEGYWVWDEEHFPGPLSPMDVSLMANPSSIKSMMKRICDDLGLPFEGLDAKIIGGYGYMRFIPPGGKDRAPPPSWLMPILVRVVPQVRAMSKKCTQAVRSKRYLQFVNTWYAEEQPRLQEKTGELTRVDFSVLSDAELEQHITSTTNLYNEVLEIHMKKIFAMALPVSQFSDFCEAQLGWERRKVIEMLGSESTSEPSRKLEALAKMALENPELVSLFETVGDGDVLRELGKVNPEFDAGLSRYLKEYGCQPAGYSLHDPTFAENPLLIVKLVREQMRRKGLPPTGLAERRRHDTIEEARKTLDRKGQRALREMFDQLLNDAEPAYPTIDGTQFFAMRCRGLFRRELLELGSRLFERGVLRKADDVFFLDIDEARMSLHGSAPGGLAELAAKRRGEFVWASSHPGPKSYGKPPGPPPSIKGFPKEVREVMRAFVWMSENMLPGGSVDDKNVTGMLRGIGASSGKYTGPVRLVRDESEFGKIRPGDVLVCPVTSPTWTVLFVDVGALVTDIGGLLSHPAIIAREYSIPAVLATSRATRVLHDDEIVTVDGDKGSVKVEMSTETS